MRAAFLAALLLFPAASASAAGRRGTGRRGGQSAASPPQGGMPSGGGAMGFAPAPSGSGAAPAPSKVIDVGPCVGEFSTACPQASGGDRDQAAACLSSWHSLLSARCQAHLEGQLRPAQGAATPFARAGPAVQADEPEPLPAARPKARSHRKTRASKRKPGADKVRAAAAVETPKPPADPKLVARAAMQNCRDDSRRFCAGVVPTVEATTACLAGHTAELSQGCRDGLRAAAEAAAEAPSQP